MGTELELPAKESYSQKISHILSILQEKEPAYKRISNAYACKIINKCSDAGVAQIDMNMTYLEHKWQ